MKTGTAETKNVPHALAAEAWRIAGTVEWEVEDWTLFYQYLTQAFVQIAGRRARQKIAVDERS